MWHLMGGHYVPSVDVRRRYSRSLDNLAEITRPLTECQRGQLFGPTANEARA
jgi:predicted ABC-type ATPase